MSTQRQAFICDYTRTPIGSYGGSLAVVRGDDLAALVLRALRERNPSVDWQRLDEVYMGCANQAGEDNRNVARMASLLAGLPVEVPGTTINRLCGSGMDAVIMAARAIKAGEIELALAGGVESMSRAPFVMPKAESAFARTNAVFDTTIGWRFVNPQMQQLYGTDSMPETAENVAADFGISREHQDLFAYNSQQKAQRAIASDRLAREITPVSVPQKRAEPIVVSADQHPRAHTSLETLAKLKAPFRDGGSVTAGNASGVNDGAAALLIASGSAVRQYQLQPLARIVGGATVGVAPRIMGIGPAPAISKLLAQHKLQLDDIGVIEINEAFAAQALASLRQLGLADDDPRVNINGGAIALGHPLGMSGARITGTATLELQQRNQNHALAAMCIGVGQGIAIALEKD